MARPRRNTNSRLTHDSGEFSAVTVTAAAVGNNTSTGYMLPYATANGLMMTGGVLNCSGGSLARQTLGLSAIYNVIHSASSRCTFATGLTGDVTGCATICSPEGGKSFGASCTQVTFVAYKLNRSGVTYSGAVSINYFAIGT